MNVPPIPRSAPPGAGLLAELHAALCRYVVFPSPHTADAVTLWTAATHAQPAWEHAPRLAVVSPLKRCGKSRLLDVVAETCHAPLITINATIAAVVRSIGADPPTLLVDEADTIFGTKRQADNNEDLRGLLNAGHQRNRPMLRWDVTTRSREELATFAMALLAAIGELPDKIMDRAVVVRMRRSAPGEHVDPYRTRRDAPPLNALRDRLTAWAREHVRELHHAQPAMPLEDRAADTWEPLIAVADLAGGDWPARARATAEAMTAAEAEHEEDTSAGVRLLGDLRTVFDADGADALYTTSVLERLHNLADAPWADWYGHPLASKDLARLLRAFDVHPRTCASPAAPTARATPAPTCTSPGHATCRDSNGDPAQSPGVALRPVRQHHDPPPGRQLPAHRLWRHLATHPANRPEPARPRPAAAADPAAPTRSQAMTAAQPSADRSKRGDRVATREGAARAVEEYLTTEELAALLKVPVRTVHHWRYRGESPPAVKIRGTLRFPLSGVQAWIKATPSPPTPTQPPPLERRAVRTQGRRMPIPLAEGQRDRGPC